MDVQIHKLLNQKQTAELLCMSEAWLEQSRFRGTGLPYVKIGKSVRYRQSDVAAWILDHTVAAGI